MNGTTQEDSEDHTHTYLRATKHPLIGEEKENALEGKSPSRGSVSNFRKIFCSPATPSTSCWRAAGWTGPSLRAEEWVGVRNGALDQSEEDLEGGRARRINNPKISSLGVRRGSIITSST